ncbi:hypothetical protein Bbelb_424720 [Branchiostoma belcheri]|nr:hypothetical protein Bbelb_424720 [Branchiostoma belcheri]
MHTALHLKQRPLRKRTYGDSSFLSLTLLEGEPITLPHTFEGQRLAVYSLRTTTCKYMRLTEPSLRSRYIRETNTKNSAEQLNSLINRYSDHIITWTPNLALSWTWHSFWTTPWIAGKTGNNKRAIVDPPPGTRIYKNNWDFDFYINKINESIASEIFAFPEWIRFYYEWAGFRDYNLVLRMIETDEDFHPIEGGYDFLVDFEDLSFPEQRPNREHAYLEIKNRIGVHRQTVLKGLFWDDLYIGFQNRISRHPDTFHFRFWNHMQILLPKQPPDWPGFLRRQRLIHFERPSDKNDSIVPRLLQKLSKAKALLVPGIIRIAGNVVYFAITMTTKQ